MKKRKIFGVSGPLGELTIDARIGLLILLSIAIILISILYFYRVGG